MHRSPGRSPTRYPVTGEDKLDKTCTAAPGRSPTRWPVKSAAPIAGPGAPSEARSNVLSGSRSICRAQAPPGNPKHLATNGLGICTRHAHRETARVATHVHSANWLSYNREYPLRVPVPNPDTRGAPGFARSGHGGNTPAMIRIRRTSTRSGWFILSTNRVVLPVGVFPTSIGPFHAKWAFHRCRRGLKSLISLPVSGSRPAMFGPLSKLSCGQDSARFA
jgi:hypothetical protein